MVWPAFMWANLQNAYFTVWIQHFSQFSFSPWKTSGWVSYQSRRFHLPSEILYVDWSIIDISRLTMMIPSWSSNGKFVGHEQKRGGRDLGVFIPESCAVLFSVSLLSPLQVLMLELVFLDWSNCAWSPRFFHIWAIYTCMGHSLEEEMREIPGILSIRYTDIWVMHINSVIRTL